MSNKETNKKIKDYLNRVISGDIKTTLDDEKLNTLKQKMLQSIELDIQKLITAETFIGGLLLRIPVVPVRDYRLRTASTDGRNIYFDIDFYTKLTPDERIFVLAHEIWHVALMHFMRRENRIHDIWNIATDCEINYALSNERFVVPPHMCYPNPEDEGKCAEDIYDNILKHQKNKNSDGFRWTKNNNSKQFSGNVKGQFDKHISNNDGEGGDGDGESSEGDGFPSDKWGEKGIDKDYTPRVDDNAVDKIREMVISEAQRYERSKGSLPDSLKRILNSICKPEVKWEELLAEFVTSCLGDRRQWLPPLRRGVYNEMYLQSRKGQKINVSCIVDTSGSTSGDLGKFLSELVSLMETFGNYELNIIHCDCAVHRVDTFDENNPFPVDTPLDYTFDGGGGSDLNPAFDKILEMGIEPSCNIVFTDGYIDCPSSNPLDVPTVFILTKDGEPPADWGTVIKFRN